MLDAHIHPVWLYEMDESAGMALFALAMAHARPDACPCLLSTSRPLSIAFNRRLPLRRRLYLATPQLASHRQPTPGGRLRRSTAAPAALHGGVSSVISSHRPQYPRDGAKSSPTLSKIYSRLNATVRQRHIGVSARVRGWRSVQYCVPRSIFVYLILSHNFNICPCSP